VAEEKGIKKVKIQRKKPERYFILYTTVTILTILFLSCIPSLNKKPVLPPEKRTKQSIKINPNEFKEKITQLEIKLMLHDTAVPSTDTIVTELTKEKILNILFHLYIHVNNPEPNYQKAVCLADSLLKIHTKEKKRLYFMNWKKMLEKYLELQTAQDSLATVITEMEEKNKSLRLFSEKKVRQAASLSAATIDSLSIIIKKQEETINKLKELDVKLERQRSKMK